MIERKRVLERHNAEETKVRTKTDEIQRFDNREKARNIRKEKYKKLDHSQKHELHTKKLNHWKTVGGEQKQKLSENKKEKYQAVRREEKKQLENNPQPSIIEEFKKQIKSGPFYICCVCNRTLYRNFNTWPV